MNERRREEWPFIHHVPPPCRAGRGPAPAIDAENLWNLRNLRIHSAVARVTASSIGRRPEPMRTREELIDRAGIAETLSKA